MVLIAPLVGPSAFELFFVWLPMVLQGFRMVLIVPPRWVIGFGARFRMVFLWFCKVFVWC